MSETQSLTNKQLVEIINNEIIDAILKSSLNIKCIPDDLEKEIYERILKVIEEEIADEVENKGFLSWFKLW